MASDIRECHQAAQSDPSPWASLELGKGRPALPEPAGTPCASLKTPAAALSQAVIDLLLALPGGDGRRLITLGVLRRLAHL